MNPQVGKVQIGIREKDIEILELYPLSIANQLEMSALIQTAMQKFFGISAINSELDEVNSVDSFEKAPDKQDDMEFISFIIELIRENITKILSFITDYSTEQKAAKLLFKITNNQAVDICSLIYAMNYEESAKNAIGLFKKATGSLQEIAPKTSLKRPLPSSLKSTPNSGSSISSDLVTEKEV